MKDLHQLLAMFPDGVAGARAVLPVMRKLRPGSKGPIPCTYWQDALRARLCGNYAAMLLLAGTHSYDQATDAADAYWHSTGMAEAVIVANYSSLQFLAEHGASELDATTCLHLNDMIWLAFGFTPTDRLLAALEQCKYGATIAS